MGFVEPTKFTWVNDRATGRQVKKGTRDTKWKARYTDPAGKDRSKTFARKADAEKFGSPRFRVGSWVAGSSRACRRRAGSGRGDVGSSRVRTRPA